MASASGGGLSLGTLSVAIVAKVDEALQSMQKFTNDVAQMIDQQKAKFESLETVGDSFTKIGGALTAAVTLPLVGVGAAAVKVSEQINTARTSFTTMLGSAEKADVMLKDLQKFAATTPFEFPDLVTSAQRMQALGVNAKQVIPWLTSIGDAAAAMGGGKDVIDGITLALGQMQAKSKVSAQEMNQLAERGVPAWQILADKIGKSVPEAMALAEKGAISAADAIPAILAGMNQKFGGSMEQLNKTLTGQWSNFKDQITQAIAPIGTALTPVLTSLLQILSPVVAKVGELANWFNTLPMPVKTFVGVLAAMLAALGPVLLIVGQLAVGIAALAPAFAALGVTLTVSVGALLGWAAAIAAAVAALVALGVWVYNNWDKIIGFIAGGLARVVEGFKSVVDGIAWLTQKIPLVGAGWAAVDKGLGNLQKSLEDTAKKHEELAARAITAAAKQATEVSKSFAIINAALAKVAADQAKAQEESDKRAKELGVSTTAALKATLDQRRKDLAAWVEDEKKGIRTHQDVAAATQAVIDAEKALAAGSPNVVAAHKAIQDAAAKQAKEEEDLGKKEIARERALTAAPGAYFAMAQSIDAYNQKLADNKKRLEEAQQAQADHLETLRQKGVIEEFKAQGEKVTAMLGEWAKAHGLLTPMINKTYDALKVLGLKGPEVYRNAADAAKQAYDTIAGDSTTSTQLETQARLKWLEAEKAAALAAGTVWTAAQQGELKGLQDALDQMEQKTVKHTQKTKTIWEEWGKAIQGIAKTFIGDVMQRLFEGSDTNKQLDQQAQELRTSLDERTADYQQHVADIQAAQEKETEDYHAALAEEDTSYEDALAKRTKDYEDFAASIPDKLAEAEKKAADKLQDTTDALNAQLADRTKDYDRYVEDVGIAIDNIREKHAESLANELADLQDSLAERNLEYDRFVEDAGAKLRELREKHGDNVADETKDVNDNIRDRTKDYERFAEDTAKKIKKLRDKNNGTYSDEEGDLVLSLQRRQEDLQQYIADQQRDLAEYKARQERDQQEEETALQESLKRKSDDHQKYLADIEQQRQQAIADNEEDLAEDIAAQKRALDRRTEDYNAYVAEIQAKQVEARNLYQTTVDEEKVALEASLNDRKADLEAYSAELLTKHEANRDKINATYADNTAKLKTELGNQESEYDTFVSDINTKLESLKAAHKTIWDDIAGFGKGAFEKIGESLAELLGEKALGALAKTLGNLITDVFPSLGTAMGKIFSAGSSAASGAAGSAGGAGSAISGIAGGALGWANLGVSVVNGIVSFFQGSEENKTLDRIVEHTLKTANDLANLRRDDWDRHAEYALWKDDILTALWGMQGNTGTALASLQAIELHCYNASASLAAMLSDSRTGDGRTFTDGVTSLLSHMAGKLDLMAAGSMNMNLYGTDPTTVAGRIATQMRLQGGRA
jgi:tape measure domain-containing protein